MLHGRSSKITVKKNPFVLTRSSLVTVRRNFGGGGIWIREGKGGDEGRL